MKRAPLSLKQQLQALNDLLTRERLAITQLRLDQLEGYQSEKGRLLALLERNKERLDPEETALAQGIKRNNDRNRLLLASGINIMKRLQDNVFRKLTLTYAAQGKSLHICQGPRMLNRSA